MLLQDAFDAAQVFLDTVIRPVHRVEIVICRCEETDEGWEFAYDSRAYLENQEFREALVGNGPVVIPRTGDAPYIRSVFPR
ncbi:YrhB family protein [Demequina sp. TTPB684]|uniref:YrhB domain-containing protein n=1 Tax=unclassified Demequina TaxID=2620311 RepID=UPI001CF3E613|nr:YrhB family protein [Demequina sp. TTPB684]